MVLNNYIYASLADKIEYHSPLVSGLFTVHCTNWHRATPPFDPPLVRYGNPTYENWHQR